MPGPARARRKTRLIARGVGPIALLILVGILGLSGCGPVTYFRTVSSTASAEVAAARAAGAERSAPYEYTSAVLYLEKAHEEAGHSDWQAAIRLGKMASEQAVLARKIALGGPRPTGTNDDPPDDGATSDAPGAE